MNEGYTLIIAYIVGLFLLCVICWIFIKPIKWVLRLILNCSYGCFAMYIINVLFTKFGGIFAINPLTIMMSGVLGLPGMIITFILQSVL